MTEDAGVAEAGAGGAETAGVVEAVFVTTAGSRPMQRVDEATAVVGQGLAGDRYAIGGGYWSGVDECEVTLIEAEGLDEITATTGIGVRDGEHRRNVVVRGVRLAALAGRRLEVGEALLAFDRPRPPCRHVEQLTEPGMTKALARRRGGICVTVVRGGAIRPGDAVRVL